MGEQVIHGVTVLPVSHVDHGLTAEQLAHLVGQAAEQHDAAGSPVLVLTVDLPEELGMVSSALYGPVAGDAPVPESLVEYRPRPGREGASRILSHARPRLTRKATVIVGPHEGRVVLFTAFGGPAASREPWDPSLDGPGRAVAEAFWAEHALALEDP